MANFPYGQPGEFVGLYVGVKSDLGYGAHDLGLYEAKSFTLARTLGLRGTCHTNKKSCKSEVGKIRIFPTFLGQIGPKRWGTTSRMGKITEGQLGEYKRPNSLETNSASARATSHGRPTSREVG